MAKSRSDTAELLQRGKVTRIRSGFLAAAAFTC